jgi:flavin reductase (DIM6/NTAB) family NADH-FMN oxidoreductase RutF
MSGADIFAPVAASTLPNDAKAYRKALGQFATGVTVVTTRTQQGVPLGLTVNSFSTLSLEPPLVLWSLRLSSTLLPHFEANGRFAVNVLAVGQASLSQRFASSVAMDKFALTPHDISDQGFVLLQGASAWFECQTVSAQEFGDHRLLVAKVLRFGQSGQSPLVFHDGQYRQLG